MEKFGNRFVLGQRRVIAADGADAEWLQVSVRSDCLFPDQCYIEPEHQALLS